MSSPPSYLTYSQLSVWRSIEFMPPERMAVAALSKVWDVPAGTTAGEIEVALGKLATRHEALRTRFELDHSDEPRQRVSDDCSPMLSSRELPVAGGGDAEVARKELGELAFDLAQDPPWRAQLLTRDGVPAQLAVCFHHLIVDAWAISQLQREFADLLAGGEPAAPAPTPAALALLQRSPARQARRDAAIEHWVSVMSGSVARPQSEQSEQSGRPEQPEQSEQSEQSGRLLTRWVSLESVPALRAANRLASAAKASVHAVVLAAYCEIVARRSGQSEFVVGLLAGNRTDSRWRELVCTMDQLSPLRYVGEPSRCFLDTIGVVYQAALTAYRHASFNVDELAEVLDRLDADGIGSGIETFFNFLPVTPAAPAGHPPFDPADPAGWRVVASDTGRDNGVPRFLHASAGDFLTLRLQEQCPDGQTETMVQDLESMQQLIVSAASEYGNG
ncbi:MAG: condensation domain-containing protein [Jatrophihabitans sp.]